MSTALGRSTSRVELEDLLADAGGAMVMRDGQRVATHFSSVAAELAVCRQSVGLAEQADIGTLELRGPAAAVQTVLKALAGQGPSPGDAVRAGEAWWCRLTPHRALAICAGEARDAVLASLVETARETDGASVVDLSGDYAELVLIGPRAEELLRSSSLAPDSPVPLPIGGLHLVSGRRPSLLLHEEQERFLVLVPRVHACEIWSRLLDAGRTHRLACVGRNALDLLRAGERSAAGRYAFW
jgi:heterotetrameric sarcosine oxidase gamma subunit